MKRNLILLTCLTCLTAFTAFGQERFAPGKIEISPFATYVDKTGDDWGLGVAGTYFLTDKIGVGASTYWADFGGTFIDNLEGEVYFRLPLFDRIAPYAVGGIGYEFETDEWFETLGVGVDFEVFEKVSAFSDIQWRFANETRNGVFLRLGVRFSL